MSRHVGLQLIGGARRGAGSVVLHSLDGVLDGGVNDSLNLDSHGKALSYLLLEVPLLIPAELAHWLVGATTPSPDPTRLLPTASTETNT